MTFSAGVEQDQEFLDRDRDLGGAQVEKKSISIDLGFHARRASWCARRSSSGASRRATRSRGCCTSPCRARCRRAARRDGGSRRPSWRRALRSRAASAKLKLSVRSPTTLQPSVSNACAEQQQLARGVDVAALAARRVPGVADLDAIDVAHDVVVARACRRCCRSRGRAPPRAACARRRCPVSAAAM